MVTIPMTPFSQSITLKLHENIDNPTLEARVGERTFFQYHYAHRLASHIAPRPYFHPILTPKGEAASEAFPVDHRWHLGLSLAFADIDGYNFWGGGTFMQGHGYVELADHGRVQHDAWLHVEDDFATERLTWRAPTGEALFSETRGIGVHWVSASAWGLNLRFDLTNITKRPLSIGSPATRGRKGVGYGGLFWRLPDAMCGGMVINDRAQSMESDGGAAIYGQPSRYLSYQAKKVVCSIYNALDNPRSPARWFVRSSDYAGFCPALAFDEPYKVQPGEVLTLKYAVQVRDVEPSQGG